MKVKMVVEQKGITGSKTETQILEVSLSAKVVYAGTLHARP